MAKEKKCNVLVIVVAGWIEASGDCWSVIVGTSEAPWPALVHLEGQRLGSVPPPSHLVMCKVDV
jgi:hypothetical protein